MFKINKSFKKNFKKILFSSKDSHYTDLYPIKNYIPDWYIKTKHNQSKELNFSQLKYKGIKQCVPFFDTLTTGYTLVTPFDIVVKKLNDFENMFSWHDGSCNFIDIRRDKDHMGLLPVPEGYQDKNYIWSTLTAIKVPKGYSLLATHPLNRYDLPFLTLSGIVDADEGMPQGNIPFYLKNNFEGVIKVGTPIVQIIPFKREDWLAEKNIPLWEEAQKHGNRSASALKGYYKKNIWKRKEYN